MLQTAEPAAAPRPALLNETLLWAVSHPSTLDKPADFFLYFGHFPKKNRFRSLNDLFLCLDLLLRHHIEVTQLGATVYSAEVRDSLARES
jgi:hypothetical protein